VLTVSPAPTVLNEYQVDDYLTIEEKGLFGFGIFDALVGTREQTSITESPAQCP
jgi:hypothetical protein